MSSIRKPGENPLRILIITPYLPHSKVGHGGGVSVRALTAQMSKLHDLTLFSLVRPGETDFVAEVESEFGIKVIPYQFNDIRSKWAKWPSLISGRAISLLKSFFSGYPYFAEKYNSRQLHKSVLKTISTLKPDVIHIEYLQLSLLLRTISKNINNGTEYSPKLVIGTHELGSLPRQRKLRKSRNAIQHKLLQKQVSAWKKLQLSATKWADKTFCVTDQDRILLENDGGVNCFTVPLGIDTDLIKPIWIPNSTNNLLFIGSFEHTPNKTCAKFLIDKIAPFIAKYNIESSLTIAGRGSKQFLDDCNTSSENISALGFVKNLDKLYCNSQLFVAPLLEGGGIKIKILEAMAYGIPVVTTPIGAEGIVDQSDNALFISSPDGSFAETVLQALNDPEESAKRAQRARMVIEERFGWSAIAELLTNLYETR